MGVGWRPDQRAAILGDDGLVPGAPVAAADGVVVVDGPAVARMFMFGASTPVQVAKMMCKRLFKGGVPSGVSVMFDIAGNMPPARAIVAAARKGVALTGAQEDEVASYDLAPFVPGHLQKKMPWELLLRHPGAKAAVWEIMGKAVFDAVVGRDPTISVEVLTAGATRTHAGVTPLPALLGTGGYGEADILVARRVRELSAHGSVCNVSTCDYDMVLQMLLARESVVRYIQFKNDAVDMEAVRARFCDGGGRGGALSAAFFLLACFKSDYSKGISGPSKTRVAALLQHMRDAGDGRGPAATVVGEAEDAAGNPVLVLRPQVLAALLTRTSLAVAANVCNILWTLSYFAEFGVPQAAGTAPPAPTAPAAGFWAAETYVVPVAAADAP